MSADLIVAALNDDADALTGHTTALLARSEDEQLDAVAQLCRAFYDFGRVVLDAAEHPKGAES